MNTFLLTFLISFNSITPSFLMIFNSIKPKGSNHGFNIATLATFAASTAYALHSSKKTSAENSSFFSLQEEEFHKMRTEIKKNSEDIKDLHTKTDNLHTKTDNVQTSISNVDQKMDKVFTKANSFISNFNFSTIKDYFTNVFNFASSFDILEQLAIYNSLSSMFLLSLFFSFFTANYGNYLIDRFHLTERYPKLNKIISYRMQVQKYYFRYLSFLAIITLLLNLSINLYAFLG